MAAIQASRLSTSFNLFGKTDFSEYKTSIFLLFLTIPGHAVFLTLKALVDPTHIGAAFYTAFFCSALIQVYYSFKRTNKQILELGKGLEKFY